MGCRELGQGLRTSRAPGCTTLPARAMGAMARQRARVMRDSKSPIHLRPATPEDRFRIRRWLAEPQVQAWWGNAASAEAEITLAMSSEAALCRIVESDGAPDRLRARGRDRPVGRAAARRAAAPAPGTSTCSSPRAQHRGRGVGAAALGAAGRGGVRHHAGGGLLRRSCRSGTRLPCGPTSGRASAGRRIWNDPLARPVLADAEGAAA